MRLQFRDEVSVEEAAHLIGCNLGLVAETAPVDLLARCMLGEVLIEFIGRLTMLGVLTRDLEGGMVKMNPNYEGPYMGR